MRTVRRTAARRLDKLVSARRKLVELEPGGHPERPLEVASAAVVELRAEGFLCPDCGGAQRCSEHRAEVVQGRSLRVVELSCRSCSAQLTLYFLIVEPLLN